ncbi:MAG TPA: M15 family metallopeptidase [Candidatus Saccharimonadales bacterium]|nr:M15 family metallopeptidase [Candidatus Saccharimonadales bacterium]
MISASRGSAEFSRKQYAAFKRFGIPELQQRRKVIVVDSEMSYEEAIGNAVVPSEGQAIHAKMKPLLRVVDVVYYGYDDRLHLGQIVVHRFIVKKVVTLFKKFLALKFPIYSVIPASKFKYIDEDSMRANNTTSYRPEKRSVHRVAVAIDFNPRTNPFDTRLYDGKPNRPRGAVYSPKAKGAIFEGSAVLRAITEEELEWGGGWGNRKAIPSTNYFKDHDGYYDYQHVQPNDSWHDKFFAEQVPRGI